MAETAATHPPGDWAAYRARLSEPGFWRPVLSGVADAEGLDLDAAVLADQIGTFPTFLSEGLVVKLYSEHGQGHASFEVERAVLKAVAATALPAPGLLSAGRLSLGESPYWYLIMTTVEGRPYSDVSDELSRRAKRIVAGVVGEWVAELHSIPVPARVLRARGTYREFLSSRRNGLGARLEAWGSLPGSLVSAAPQFVERWLPADGCTATGLVHGDLHGHHLFGAGRRWRPTAIIDFADSRCADPHYELGALVTGTFDGHPASLEAFLAGYGWQVDDRTAFGCRALATALLHDWDIFAGWRERTARIKSLDELAARLFAPSR